LAVVGIKEREVLERAAAATGVWMERLPGQLAAMGKALGPPWTLDEKLSAAAALAISKSRSGEIAG
jgi:hypothetical protein